MISIKRGMATCAELPMAPDRIDNALRAFWRGRTTPLARLIGERPGEFGVCSMLMALLMHARRGEAHFEPAERSGASGPPSPHGVASAKLDDE